MSDEETYEMYVKCTNCLQTQKVIIPKGNEWTDYGGGPTGHGASCHQQHRSSPVTAVYCTNCGVAKLRREELHDRQIEKADFEIVRIAKLHFAGFDSDVYDVIRKLWVARDEDSGVEMYSVASVHAMMDADKTPIDLDVHVKLENLLAKLDDHGCFYLMLTN
jgi:hypothetical protein